MTKYREEDISLEKDEFLKKIENFKHNVELEKLNHNEAVHFLFSELKRYNDMLPLGWLEISESTRSIGFTPYYAITYVSPDKKSKKQIMELKFFPLTKYDVESSLSYYFKSNEIFKMLDKERIDYIDRINTSFLHKKYLADIVSKYVLKSLPVYLLSLIIYQVGIVGWVLFMSICLTFSYAFYFISHKEKKKHYVLK